MAVFLDVGAAARGVDHDCFDIRLFKYIDGFSREFLSLGFFAGVDEQRSAAGLLRRRYNFASFGKKRTARGGGIYLREKCALHAAEEKSDAFALLALRGRGGCDRLLIPALRWGEERPPWRPRISATV